jgi:addiction module HigA family antidote
MPKRRSRSPTHPGALLREIVLPALGVTVSQAAREMQVSRQQLHKILAEERSITADMAARLGRYCGNGPDLWLNMQSAYDLWQAERRLGGVLRTIPARAPA